MCINSNVNGILNGMVSFNHDIINIPSTRHGHILKYGKTCTLIFSMAVDREIPQHTLIAKIPNEFKPYTAFFMLIHDSMTDRTNILFYDNMQEIIRSCELPIPPSSQWYGYAVYSCV